MDAFIFCSFTKEKGRARLPQRRRPSLWPSWRQRWIGNYFDWPWRSAIARRRLILKRITQFFIRWNFWDDASQCVPASVIFLQRDACSVIAKVPASEIRRSWISEFRVWNNGHRTSISNKVDKYIISVYSLRLTRTRVVAVGVHAPSAAISPPMNVFRRKSRWHNLGLFGFPCSL